MRYIHFIMIFIIYLNITNANELKYETSPYLKQHANNPINWHAYNDKTLALAKTQNKAIFLSIGYSTCHWCHVMAKESFENEELAKLFNKYFISIKIDKEEMPHIDGYYQNLFKKLKHHPGGWPINIFLTSDMKVFYMQGYIPPSSSNEYIGFDKLLPKLSSMYKNNLLNKEILNIQKISKQSYKTKEKKWDELSAGFGEGTKFPEAHRVHLMLDNKEYEKAKEMLDAMALRGLYDHVDGGFFRYSTDADWDIPHFEKMLYNQAELIYLYSRAYEIYENELYKNIVIETIEMLDRFFLKDDFYYSAMDAVSDGVEGGYYTFSKKELEGFLPFIAFGPNYHIVLQTSKRPRNFAESVKKLKLIRKNKKVPFIDKKINTAWNALLIEALYKAGSFDNKYIKKADKHLKALSEFMFEKGELYHQSLIGEKPTQLGFLEDYSFMISAILAGYKVTSESEKIGFAKYLYTRAKYKFYKDGIWYASDDGLNIKADIDSTHYTSALKKLQQSIIKYKLDKIR